MVDYEALYQTKEDLVDAAKFIAKLPRIYANYPTLVGEERGINKGAVASLCFFVGAVEGLHTVSHCYLCLISYCNSVIQLQP